ncbi:HNH endonuclease signature motif containing protein [Polluticoccus soli]|uniref:HNH endonuclease signature motif containing protein n=1 Tax=Polluticoccus soli TaxID=3034150 RepID=UPI0023E0F43E|nr:HNH endonuclease signature motif containing protein [Flavipsychrobacter sp. JY13-12]
MNKDQYFKISETKKLPNRCPLLNICQRAAFTNYLFSYYKEVRHGLGTWEDLMKSHGDLSDKYFNEKIEVQGEGPTIIKGANHWYFQRACPEINLFEDSIAHFEGQPQACTSGDWDNERRTNKLQISNFKHYSECAEFSHYLYNKKPLKMTNTKTRTKIPKEAKVRAELQKEINSCCPFCENDDVGHFEIHHIDEDPSNHQKQNLLLLCRNCHSKITKGDISQPEVFKKKISLLSKPVVAPKVASKTVNVSNTHNAIVGDKNKITINNNKKTVKQKYPPDCIGYDAKKALYVGHLIQRYNEYKEYEVGKGGVKYHVFGGLLKKEFNVPATRTIYNLPIDKFDDLVAYIQSRINGTKLAKVKGRDHKNFSTFEEFQEK